MDMRVRSMVRSFPVGSRMVIIGEDPSPSFTLSHFNDAVSSFAVDGTKSDLGLNLCLLVNGFRMNSAGLLRREFLVAGGEAEDMMTSGTSWFSSSSSSSSSSLFSKCTSTSA